MPRRETKFSDLSLLLLLLLLLIACAKAALFDGCDKVHNINPGVTFNLGSPNYPNNYAPSSSCRYKFVAPLDHEIHINCSINTDKLPNSQCSTEFIYVARDGDLQLRGAEYLCGTGTFVRSSIFRPFVLAYESRGSWGKFFCQVRATPQTCDCGWSVNSKIVNGVEASVNEFPSIVVFKDTTNPYLEPICGGTIITHRFILTTTGCARKAATYSAVAAFVGQHDLTAPNRYAAQYAVQQFIEHPNYNNNPVRNDLAIARTVAAIDWSRGVGPACLLPPDTTNLFVGYYADVAGWGPTSFTGPALNILKKASLEIITDTACQTFYPNIYNQMCTSAAIKDTCRIDFGGPNYLRFGSRQFVIGCISYGKGCGGSNFASVNTRLTSHLSWIYDTIAYSSCMAPIN